MTGCLQAAHTTRTGRADLESGSNDPVAASRRPSIADRTRGSAQCDINVDC